MAFGEATAERVESINQTVPSTVEWKGYQLINASVADTVGWLSRVVTEKGYQRLSFASAHTFYLAEHDPYYATALRRISGLLTDRSGVAAINRNTDYRTLVHLNARQIIPRLFDSLSSGTKIFLIGASPAQAQHLASNIGEAWPHLCLVGNEIGDFEAWEAANLVNTINASHADIVIAGMDTPRQEQWMDRHAATINAPLVLGVGGLFEFMASHAFGGTLCTADRHANGSWRFHLKGPALIRS
ncbi:MAG: WecB/TagA/CpsF family glycosyltransferase [Pseudomonadota bacterium]